MYADTRENKKKMLDFLVCRWMNISGLSAIETIYNEVQPTSDNGIMEKEIINYLNPTKQIKLIKKYITSLLPKSKFINYDYQSPAPLNIKDFQEMYMADQLQCAGKVTDLIKQMK